MKLVVKGLLVLGFVTLSACSVSKKDDDDDTVYSKLSLTGSTVAANDGNVEFTKVECEKNADSLLFTATFTAANKATFKMKVRDFKVKSYSCQQPANNQTSTSSVGDKYDNCGLELVVPSSSTATTFNTYATYRDTTEAKPFTFGGACIVDVKAVEGTASGTVTCTKMIMYKMEDTILFPLQAPYSTTDISGTFSCNLK